MAEAQSPAPSPAPARSWFRSDVASNLQGRVESLESCMQTLQSTVLTTLPRYVQGVGMSIADFSSRQNAVEKITVENHHALCQQFYSLAEIVDEHSNLLRQRPDESDWHINNAEHSVLSPGKSNKELEIMLGGCKAQTQILEGDLKQLASHGSGAKDPRTDDTMDFIKTVDRLDAWYSTLEQRLDSFVGRMAHHDNGIIDCEKKIGTVEMTSETYSKVTDGSADAVKTLDEQYNSLEASYKDIKTQLETTLHDIQTQIMACGDALNDIQVSKDAPKDEIREPHQQQPFGEQQGSSLMPPIGHAPVLPIAQPPGVQLGTSQMPPTLVQQPQAAAANMAHMVPQTQYHIPQQFGHVPQQPQQLPQQHVPLVPDKPFNPPPGSNFVSAESGGMFSKQRLVRRNLDDETVDAVEKPWKIMRKQTDGLPVLAGATALENYKAWKRDMVAHIAYENSRWSRYLKWAAQANNRISPEWLLQMKIDAYTGADPARELYNFIFKFVDKSLTERMPALAGGCIRNGFRVWRELFNEYEGGDATIKYNQRIQLQKFKQCSSIKHLSRHLDSWYDLVLQVGDGIPEETLQAMLTDTLPNDVKADVRKRLTLDLTDSDKFFKYAKDRAAHGKTDELVDHNKKHSLNALTEKLNSVCKLIEDAYNTNDSTIAAFQRQPQRPGGRPQPPPTPTGVRPPGRALRERGRPSTPISAVAGTAGSRTTPGESASRS